MKIFVTMIIVLMVFGTTGFAQSKVDVGLNAVLGIPVGETADHYGMGFGGGLWVIIPLSSPTVSIALGGGVESYSGKSVTERSSGSWGWMEQTTTYHDMTFGSLFFGPKIGQETGPYFLPAVSLNYGTEFRMGFDIGGGLLFPMGTGMTKFNLGAKYSIINLIGASDNEASQSGIRIVVGIVF
jgi:hypothetical protein